MIYIICRSDYHSLEIAFTSRTDAAKWIGDQVGRYDIVPVQLSWEGEEGVT